MVGAVYDRGYRGYEGERGGQRAARAALFRGVGPPGPRHPPAVAAEGCARGAARHRHRAGHRVRGRRLRHPRHGGRPTSSGSPTASTSVSRAALLVFVALTAPDIMCPDRRQRVLPLLFARPLTGVDYVLAKVGAMFAIVFAFSFLPQVVLFLGQMLVSEDGALRYARDNAEVIWQVPVAVACLSIFYAVIGVAIVVAHLPSDHRGRGHHRPVPRHVHRQRDPGRARARRPCRRARARSTVDGDHRDRQR